MKMRNTISIATATLAAASVLVLTLAGTSDPAGGIAGKESVSPVAVEVTAAASSTISESVCGVGAIAALRDVTVSSETSGRVTRVPITVGNLVRAGDTLVQVDDEMRVIAVEQARAQLLAAETNLQKATSDLARAETLKASGDIAEVELEGTRLALHAAEAQQKAAAVGLRLAQRQLEDTRIKAPISGVIASKRIEVGEMVGPGKEVANIVDMSRLKVKVSLPEDEIGSVQPGQRAVLGTGVRPGQEIAGIVQSVGAKTESPTGHTYPVEIIIARTPNDGLKVGMFATVSIQGRTISNSIVISKESLTGDASHPSVFVAEQGVAHLRPVRLGLTSGEKCQVLEGLKPGDLVISFGHQNVKEGSLIRHP